MSYELYDGEKYLGPLATNSGLKDAREAVMSGAGPNLYSLLLNGYTYEPKKAAAELAQVMAEKKMASDVKKTLLNLHKMLMKASTVAVIE